MNKTSGFGFALLTLLTTAPAGAHIDLLSPTARLKGQDGSNQLKTKPCGQTTNKRTTDKVTTFTPGQKVDIKIKEYINHPGYFAVAFDPDGDDSFVFPRENPDKVNMASDDPKTLFPVDGVKVLGLRTDKEKDCYTENTSTHECTISITIPNMTCQNCTLQVTQFMYDKLGNSSDDEYYYQCADIKIEGTVSGGSGGAGGTAGGGSGGSAGGSASGGTGGAASGGAGGSATTGGSGGTPASSGGTPASAGSTSSSAGTLSATAGSSSAGSSTTTTDTAPEESGCSVGRGAPGSASALAALGLLFGLVRRRRSRV